MNSETTVPKVELAEWQIATIDLFVNLATSLGFQKSIGQIYGLLYASSVPLCLDDIVEILSISKGSASQGLRTLRHLGAAKLVFVPGERKDHFEPEIRLKQLVTGLIKNQVLPQLRNGEDRVEHIRTLWDQENEKQSKNGRIEKLATWTSKTNKFLPLIRKIIGEN